MRDDDRQPLPRTAPAACPPSALVWKHAVRDWVLSIGLLVAALLLTAAPASAHGRLGSAEGRCRLFIGPDIMNFTGYTPDASKSEFCEDIPATGRMIMVLDAEQEEMRDMKLAIRIVKDVGGEEKEGVALQPRPSPLAFQDLLRHLRNVSL